MGTVACGLCKGSGRYYAKSGKALNCRACGGTGVNKDLWSTRCERCRTEIIYKAGTNTPQFCKSCRDIDLEKPCAQMGCTNVIRYKVGWKNVSNYCKRCENKRQQGWSASTCPGTGVFGCGKLIWSPPGKRFDLCPDCSAKKRAERDSKRREKTCQGIKGGPYCGKTIVYYTDSKFVPDLCPDCRAKAKAAKEERERNKRTKPCPNCGNTITYFVGGKEFDYCKTCSDMRLKVDRNDKGTLQARTKDGTLLFTFARCSYPKKGSTGEKAHMQYEWASRGYYYVAMPGNPHMSYIVDKNPVENGFLTVTDANVVRAKFPNTELEKLFSRIAIAIANDLL